jgi:sortase A
LIKSTFNRSRALPICVLLFFVLATLAACGGSGVGNSGSAGGGDAGGATSEVAPAGRTGPATSMEETKPEETGDTKSPGSDEKTDPSREGGEKEAPSEKAEQARAEGDAEFPEYRDFYEDSGSEPIQIKSAGSAGAIPAVKPFNFGRDPGGPEDRTLYLTVPRLGLEDVPVYNSTSEEDLTRSAVHVPATGFPWQEGANVFIAGHRIGYEGTGSYQIFYDIDQMREGDEITVTDADGNEYRYRMTSLEIVSPDNVEVMNPVEGKDIISLQSCTLPDYKERVIVQGEKVEGGEA